MSWKVGQQAWLRKSALRKYGNPWLPVVVVLVGCDRVEVVDDYGHACNKRRRATYRWRGRKPYVADAIDLRPRDRRKQGNDRPR